MRDRLQPSFVIVEPVGRSNFIPTCAGIALLVLWLGFLVPVNAQALPTAIRQANSQSANRCDTHEQHVFDFMLGNWRTSEPPGEGSPSNSKARFLGESKVEKLLSGCALHEHRRVSRQGKRLLDVDIFWGYDAPTKRWQMIYFDERSFAHVYQGWRNGNTWSFHRERMIDNGKPVLVRLTFLDANYGFTQKIEESWDNGTSWKISTMTEYKRSS